MSAITARFSVRAFTDQPITKDTIEDILRRARQGPSGSAGHRYELPLCKTKAK